MDAKNNKQPVRNALGRGLSALISTPPVAVMPGRGNAARALTVESPLVSQTEAENKGALSIEPQNSPDIAAEKVAYLAMDKILPNPFQPRQDFNDVELQELAASIKAHGVLQPVLVRENRDPGTTGLFEIVAGERRWRAAKIAELTQLPVIIRKITNPEALEVALIENVQREDLNPVEQARAYQRLMDEFSLSQEQVGEKVGKDRASIANFVRLLKLPGDVLELLRSGRLSAGHAKAILTIKEPSAQISLAKKAVREGLSVRALEAIVARVVVLDSGRRTFKQGQEGDGRASLPSFPEVVDRMRNVLGTKVTIKHLKSGRGKIEIEYFSEQELDRLIEHICGL